MILCFSLFSCVSTIPGEKEIILKNLSAEYFNIGENYFSQKNYPKAIENYQLSLRSAQTEDLNQIKYQLASAYVLNKNYKEAEDIFLKLYQQEKDNIILAQSLAYCYAKNGKIEDSLLIYKDIYTQNPYQEDIGSNYFLLLLEANEIDEAKIVLEKIKTDFPESSKIPLLEENLKKANDNLSNMGNSTEDTSKIED